LSRVDEDRDDDPLDAPLRALDQGEMSGMERSHGRNQRDSFALGTPLRHRAGERR